MNLIIYFKDNRSSLCKMGLFVSRRGFPDTHRIKGAGRKKRIRGGRALGKLS